ncbi:MAG: UbiD family decarboxylase [Magnetococcales bacterium]|nr:UbiD family decarboxylase [Magnetococcales bacterium]
MDHLESHGELVEVNAEVDSHLEITEICRRLLAEGGPAVLFNRVEGSDYPILANLFGTERRVGMAVGKSLQELEALGTFLAELKQPDPPRGLKEATSLASRMARVRHMPTKTVRRAPCQEVVWNGTEIDLNQLPIQICWPGDAAPLITWGMVITKGEDEDSPVNLGIYRMQLIGPNKLIMRWLRHRGGALHAREFKGPMPVAVAIGGDPGTILAAVTPVPETLSEYAFAGLLREERVHVVDAGTVPLQVPAGAEIILEGSVDLEELADEGPFGDHTGYYNEVEKFPVFTVNRVTMRRDPIYLSTFTGRPPDEPAILALALNRVFVPLLRKQFPEIIDFHLPMEACSYRVAVISLQKQYPGHAFRVMTGVWSFLRQFLYTKYIIVVDADVPVMEWQEVMAAIGYHVHAGRDIQLLTNTPIDYLDFASPLPGLGSKMAIDATTKIGVERQVVEPLPAPPLAQTSNWPTAIVRTIPYITKIYRMSNGCMAVVQVNKCEPAEGRKAIEAVWRMVPPGSGADQLWIVDKDVDPSSWSDLLWSLATRTDPARDAVLDKESGRFAIDATNKLADETNRQWGKKLEMAPAIIEKVSRRWREYGLPGSGNPVA